VSTCIEASGDYFTAPVINLRALFCITSSLFKIAGVAVINASQPYCTAGFICALYVSDGTKNLSKDFPFKDC
jgi:hypothetical protein